MLLDRVGTDRLVWGSDWPWTQHPEATRYGAMLDWLADWIPDVAVRRCVLASNAQRLFGFTPRT
jgi:predicted TIM-barrel fold metal-dependent hydrolase